MIFNITSTSNTTLEKELRHKIDHKTKPHGALGQLEAIALKIGLIQNTLTPKLNAPNLVVFAGDHGIAKAGVSAYPSEVTPQMVLNFLSGGAAINVFCKQNGINLSIVDAGVNFDFSEQPALINAKIGYGTNNFLEHKAMTFEACGKAINQGGKIVERIHESGCNVIGFGEMGIGNTSSASILMSLLCDLDIEACVGKGTGLNNEGLQHKINTLKTAIKYHQVDTEKPLEVLSTFGGFEIAMMCGAMLKAAALKMVVLVDGFIASAALLTAFKLNPNILDYTIFCHQSDESGHKKLLDYLEVTPMLNLNMRLGEGTGCGIAYPLVQSAVNFLNEMASFESAGVSEKNVEV